MCRWGWVLGKMGLWPSLYDNVVSWLRLQTLIDFIPHPYWMYTKYFSTLRCCGWAYECIIIAVLHMQVGGGFRGNAVLPSLYDVAVSWLRLQTPIDCIPHPYKLYTKCFSTLRCCRWPCGCTLMQFHYMCRWGGGILGEMGYGQACMMLQCHGWGFKPQLTASHIHIGCIQSVLAPWDAVDGHMGASLCWNTCAGGGEF